MLLPRWSLPELVGKDIPLFCLLAAGWQAPAGCIRRLIQYMVIYLVKYLLSHPEVFTVSYLCPGNCIAPEQEYRDITL